VVGGLVEFVQGGMVVAREVQVLVQRVSSSRKISLVSNQVTDLLHFT